jgi:hypothetical protein
MATTSVGTDAGGATPPAQTQIPPVTPAVAPDAVAAGLQSISTQLQRRGYLTTEWWTIVIGTAVTLLLAYLRPGDTAAPQTAAIVAPAVLAAAYSVSRTMHKSALADVLQAALPQVNASTEVQ